MTSSFPADALFRELIECSESPKLVDEDPLGESLAAVLASAIEADVLDDAPSRDVDHVLGQWPRQGDRAREAMMSGAVRGLALRRGIEMPVSAILDQLRECRSSLVVPPGRESEMIGEEVACLDAFLAELGTAAVRVENCDRQDFAYWISEFGIPEDLLFSAIHPRGMENAGEPFTGQFAIVRAGSQPWEEFRRDVRQQVAARRASPSFDGFAGEAI